MKENLSLCLTKYLAMKPYPLLNQVPRFENTLKERRKSSTPSQPRHQMEVSG